MTGDRSVSVPHTSARSTTYAAQQLNFFTSLPKESAASLEPLLSEEYLDWPYAGLKIAVTDPASATRGE